MELFIPTLNCYTHKNGHKRTYLQCTFEGCSTFPCFPQRHFSFKGTLETGAHGQEGGSWGTMFKEGR